MPTLPFKTITVNGQKYEVSKAVITFANLTYVSQSAGILKFTSDLAFDQALLDFKAGKSLMVHTDYLSMFGDVQITESLDGTKLQGVGNLSGQLVGYNFYPYYDEQTQEYDYTIWMCARQYYNDTSSTVGSVTVTQVVSTGTKIATVDVDGVSTDLYAPAGGGSTKKKIYVEVTSMSQFFVSPGTQVSDSAIRGITGDYSSFATLKSDLQAGTDVDIYIRDSGTTVVRAPLSLGGPYPNGEVAAFNCTNATNYFGYKIEQNWGTNFLKITRVAIQ